MAKTYFLLSPNVIPKFLKIDVDVSENHGVHLIF